MLGVVVNTLGAALGALVGLLARKGIPERFNEHIYQGIALFVIYIGIAGVIESRNSICMIISIAIGALIGEALDLDRHLKNFADRMEKRVRKDPEKGGSFAEAFVTTAIIQCVGAYTVVGGLQAGLKGDYSMLFSKAGLDFTASIVLAASMGIGVLLASGVLFIVTGAIVILAQFIAPFLPDPVITEIMAVGSMIIIAQALNMLKVTDLKIMNFVPAMLLPIAVVPIYDYVVAAI